MTDRTPAATPSPVPNVPRRTRSLRQLTTIGMTALIAAVAAPAFAEQGPVQAAGEARVDARQARQEARIDQGIRSGSLTPHEARRLGREQAGIARAESRAEADAHLNRREARRLEARQDAASRHVRRQKQDGQVRPMP
jgi:hypothetical protein